MICIIYIWEENKEVYHSHVFDRRHISDNQAQVVLVL